MRGMGGAGVVALWDVATGQQLAEYEAHQKRIWAVDFSHSDPLHFVSGSDDGWVRVWSTTHQDALAQIDMKANVCCVKYNAAAPHQARRPHPTQHPPAQALLQAPTPPLLLLLALRLYCRSVDLKAAASLCWIPELRHPSWHARARPHAAPVAADCCGVRGPLPAPVRPAQDGPGCVHHGRCVPPPPPLDPLAATPLLHPAALRSFIACLRTPKYC